MPLLYVPLLARELSQDAALRRYSGTLARQPAGCAPSPSDMVVCSSYLIDALLASNMFKSITGNTL